MAKKKIMVCECGCERCSHHWIARSTAAPFVCPKCKSPYWDKPLKKKSKKNK